MDSFTAWLQDHLTWDLSLVTGSDWADEACHTWLESWECWDAVDVPKVIPPMYRLPPELILLITETLDIDDKLRLALTCRSARLFSECECCRYFPCQILVNVELDYRADLREARLQYLSEAALEPSDYDYNDQWDDYDPEIDWEAE